jgi:hypothetical protein
VINVLSGGVTFAALKEYSVRASTHSVFVVRTHERIAHVLAAVLVYLYIFLSLSTGPPLRGTAPTFPLPRPALAFGTLGLLLICGVNEW